MLCQLPPVLGSSVRLFQAAPYAPGATTPGEVRASAYWSAPSAISSASLPSSSSAVALGVMSPPDWTRWAASRASVRAPKGLLSRLGVAPAGSATSAADAVMAQTVSHRLLRVGADTGSSRTDVDTAVAADPITCRRERPGLEESWTRPCHYTHRKQRAWFPPLAQATYRTVYRPR